MEDPAPPHGCRLRIGRYSQANGCYLITTVTHRGIPLFSDFNLARLLVQVMRHQHDRCLVDSLAFVVMPDHLHWLIQVREPHPLSRIIQYTKAMSARRINALRGCPGAPVCQKGFHDHAVRREEDLRHLARYVIANPLRAGLVSRIGDYPLWDAVWL
jgi:putative transposase